MRLHNHFYTTYLQCACIEIAAIYWRRHTRPPRELSICGLWTIQVMAKRVIFSHCNFVIGACHHPLPCWIDVSLFLYICTFCPWISTSFTAFFLRWQCIFYTCTMYQLTWSPSIWQLYRHIVIMKYYCRNWKMVQVRSVVSLIMISLQKISYLKQMEILFQQLDTSL